ncbi:DUF7857 domain-containing protein [Haloparvum sedimenti]|uniref:DUF7857 domain-containing protein n=1 Tax=Haloparvum sedimenti TaxID=1678448 RepID=UPI00071E74CE|nr:hypothetical protein [Haloparvum sedimenti]
MDLQWTRRREAGVAFVACRLVNDASVPRNARLENRLDGPVLPPRRGGVPEAGWDADGATLAVDAGETRAVGYACPAPTTESDGAPVELASVERADEVDTNDTENGPDPTAAIRTLGDHRPPREACDPQLTVNAPHATAPPETASSAAEAPAIEFDEDSATARSSSAQSGEEREDGTTVAPAEPAAVEAWLDAVERRVARAERLDGADVATATEVFAITGGAAAAADLVARVESDADRLTTVAERAHTLAERAAATEPPTDAFDRLV